MINAKILNGLTSIELGENDSFDLILTELSCLNFDIISNLSNHDSEMTVDVINCFINGFLEISKELIEERNNLIS